MNDCSIPIARARFAVGVLLGLASAASHAQSTSPSTGGGASTGSGGTVAPDPNPYYLGASQGFTHDSNVYRTPFGRNGGKPDSDNYSSTSLFGGFDQLISRQRVFGSGNVSLNRYNKENELDNTSYNLAAGLDWATIEKLSGNLNVGISRSLASPARDDETPSARRNTAETRSIDGRARWGGASVLTLEAAAGYSKLDYSEPEYDQSEASSSTASLSLFYRPGGLLRLGLALRGTRTRTPNAFFDPTTNVVSGNTQKGRNIDLLADYDLSGLVSTSGRLSYTKQTNSQLDNEADFSGLTGSLNISYRATGKISTNAYASRDAGFNSSVYGSTTPIGTGSSEPVAPVPVTATGLYENNQVTNAFGLGLNYQATAKISATLGARYARARLVSNSGDTSTRDVLKTAYLGANYAIARSVGVSCNLGREVREVAGDAVNYSYNGNTVGCSAQFVWR